VAISAGQVKGNTVVAVAAFGRLRRRTVRKMQTVYPAVALAVDELERSEDLEMSKD
jgi:hypothetical protein